MPIFLREVGNQCKSVQLTHFGGQQGENVGLLESRRLTIHPGTLTSHKQCEFGG